MKEMQRREFIKDISLATLGMALGPAMLDLTSKKVLGKSPKSKVIIVQDPNATGDNGKIVNAAKVHEILDVAVKQLSGQTTIAEAYLSLFPDLGKDDMIAIKANCMETWWFGDSCRETINGIVAGLKLAGASENNIIIYDIKNADLVKSGYILNNGPDGVRCFGSDEDGWGYAEDIVKPGGQSIRLSKILTECDHLINIPVLRDHPSTGISLSMKNHYGSVNCPSCLHGPAFSCDPHIAELNNLAPIKEKTRLIVCPALTGAYQGHHSPPQFLYNGLIVSQDSVALDHTGWDIIDEQRVMRGLGTLTESGRLPRFLETAAKLELGNNDPENIDLVMIGEGQAVHPQDTIFTTWGSTKAN